MMSSSKHNDLAVVFVAHTLGSSFAASAFRIRSRSTRLGWARGLCAPLGGVQTLFGHRNDRVAQLGVGAGAGLVGRGPVGAAGFETSGHRRCWRYRSMRL